MIVNAINTPGFVSRLLQSVAARISPAARTRLAGLLAQAQNLSLRSMLTIFFAASVAAVLIPALVALLSADTGSMPAALYAQISTDNALLADILPPPAHLMESYATAGALILATDPGQQAALVERMAVLQEEFIARHEYWQANQPEGDLKTLLQTTDESAQLFFSLFRTRLVPALAVAPELAARVFNLELAPVYAEHRAVMEAAAQIARQQLQDRAGAAPAGGSTGLLAVGAGLVLVLAALYQFSKVSLRRSLGAAINSMTAAASTVSANSEQVALTVLQQAAAADNSAVVMQAQSAAFAGCAAAFQELHNALADTSTASVTTAQSARAVGQDTLAVLGGLQAQLRANAEQLLHLAGHHTQIGSLSSCVGEFVAQSNLLARRAAVAATRSGEHGKGFAVVAAEVRKLAERSQNAAQEINSLTSSSVRVAERSGELLKRLVPSIRKTAELVQQVAIASREQAEGVSQVNQAMNEVDQVTQRNAAAAEELSSTAAQMSAQAESLRQSMSSFKITGIVNRFSSPPEPTTRKPLPRRSSVGLPKPPPMGAVRKAADHDGGHEFQHWPQPSVP